jgi:hypothetical protein
VVIMQFFKSASVRVRSTQFAACAGLVLAAIGASSCGSDTMTESQSSSYLVLSVLEGASGAEESPIFSTFLQSDVRTGGGIVEDVGRVRMGAAMKDVTNPVGPSSNNAITVTRYRVEFRRADGRNTPGVDVPYAFDGGVTFTVAPGDEAIVPFVLVRVQSKLEPPLSNMNFRDTDFSLPNFPIAGAGVISTLADVTFFGRDQTGREVSVKGTISINFADWADPL